MSTATFTAPRLSTPRLTAPQLSAARVSAPRPSAPRLRLTRRGRAVLTVLVAAPLVAGSVFVTLNGGGATATSETSQSSFEYVTVQPGMTLWGLAADTAPQADPRDFAAAVISLNQLPSAELSIGDRLAIPAKYSE